MMALKRAAIIYGERGLAALPLVLDSDGFAKMPLRETAWLHYLPSDNPNQEWDKAKGIGLALGPPSGNLAVLDVDDMGLAEGIERHFLEMSNPPLMARTPRHHLHVFCVEPTASVPVDIEARWQNRWAKVQLLGKTRQVAVHPTPGYSWVNPSAEPAYAPLDAFWHRLALDLNLNYRLARYTPDRARDWSRKLP